MTPALSAFASDFEVLRASLTDRYVVVANADGKRSVELATSDRAHALASALGAYAGRAPAVYKRVTPITWGLVYREARR